MGPRPTDPVSLMSPDRRLQHVAHRDDTIDAALTNGRFRGVEVPRHPPAAEAASTDDRPTITRQLARLPDDRHGTRPVFRRVGRSLHLARGSLVAARHG